MVATFGLERLESALETRDPDENPFVGLVLHTAPPVDRVQRPVPTAPHSDHNADRVHVGAAPSGLAVFDDEPGLPTRLCGHDVGNPQFPPTRHANPV